MVKRHTVRVPAAHAAVVLDALVTTYAVKADALAGAVGAYQSAAEPLAAVRDARGDLANVEDVLDALGWQEGSPAADLELSGPAGLVRETLYGALLAAIESATDACREYEAGRADRSALAAAIRFSSATPTSAAQRWIAPPAG